MASPDRRRPFDLRVPPALIASAAALTQMVLTRAVPPPTTTRRTVAAALAIAGATIGIRGVLHFRTAGTTVHPHHPENTQTLVTTGVFSRTRNPMYLGMAIGLLAIAVDRGRPVALLPILGYAAFLDQFQIRPEEEVLRGLFGKDYDTYARRVRRWC